MFVLEVSKPCKRQQHNLGLLYAGEALNTGSQAFQRNFLSLIGGILLDI